MYQIVYSRTARKQILDIPTIHASNIKKHIEALASDPYPPGIKHLTGNKYRQRVGVYRIAYEIFNDRLIVEIIKVEHRKSVYR